jgi:hypothetical protein
MIFSLLVLGGFFFAALGLTFYALNYKRDSYVYGVLSLICFVVLYVSPYF